MLKKEKKFVPIKILVVYSILFYLAWVLYEFLLRSYFDLIANEVLSSFVKSGVIKNLVWTLPAFILIYKNKDSVSIDLKEMFTPKRECIKYLWIFAAFTLYIILGSLIQSGKIALSDDFGAEEIITVLFVGITEESVFRGWLLNSTVERNKNAAIAVNSLMFLCIHFPIWIYEGVFINNFVNSGFICIIVLSVIFSIVFIKTRNIIFPIALHMFWDLLMFMLF